MRIRKTVSALIIGAGFGAGAFMLGSGTASANTTVECKPHGDQRVIEVRGNGGCSADSGPGSRAYARDSGGGIAVAGSRKGGNGNAINLAPNGTSLSYSEGRGSNGLALTFGNFGASWTQATPGEIAVAIAGWSGDAKAGYGQAICTGSSVAFSSKTGQACLNTGGLYFGTPGAKKG